MFTSSLHHFLYLLEYKRFFKRFYHTIHMKQDKFSFNVKKLEAFPLNTMTEESKSGNVVFSRIVSKRQTFFKVELDTGDFFFTYIDGSPNALVESYAKFPHKTSIAVAFERVWRKVVRISRKSIPPRECAIEIVELLEKEAIPFLNSVLKVYVQKTVPISGKEKP